MNAVAFEQWLLDYAKGQKCRPLWMGILNVTPDSFSDGGRYNHIDSALQHVEAMLEQGADIIDIGGESTRPSAQAVDVDEELRRVIPIIHAIRQRFDVCLSIDTYKNRVMDEAIQAGADMINDVYALTQPGALDVAIKYQKPVCLMHSGLNLHQGLSNNEDLMTQILVYLTQRMNILLDRGLPKHLVILDPGIGFAKDREQSLYCMRQLSKLCALNQAVLIGVSKKSFMQATVQDRGLGTCILNSIAYMQGCRIFRVHDIMPNIEAINMTAAVFAEEDKQ